MIARKPLIVEAFENLVALPENEGRKLELINGEIVEEMPNRLHALIATLLGKIFGNYLDVHPIGWAFTEARIKFPDDSLNDFIPDFAVALAANHNIQNDDLNEPFTTTPELVIEIQSPDQSEKFMSDKADVYLKYGARIAITVYPSFRAVEIRRPTSMRRYFEGESIDLGDLLPGLIIAVSDIFPQFDNQ
ncbi:MAG: Uma2 family endonuclease [Chloroflexota bacterium]